MSKIAEKIEVFNFKSFDLWQSEEVMKVSTDSILLGAWATHSSHHSILDIGTGTGILSLMLAQKYSQSIITGIEIDPKACTLARYNCTENKWHDRIKIVETAFQDFETDLRFDLIISNPPFFNRKDLYDRSAKQGMRNELSLPHGDLLRKVSQMLSDDGAFILILPYLEGLRFVELAEMYSLFPSEIVHVRGSSGGNVKRVLLKLHGASEKMNPQIEELTIRSESGEYSSAFRQLTEAFYQ